MSRQEQAKAIMEEYHARICVVAHSETHAAAAARGIPHSQAHAEAQEQYRELRKWRDSQMRALGSH